MDARQRVDGLDFHNDRVSDQEVDSIAGYRHLALIGDRQRHLATDRQAPSAKLVGKTCS